MTKTKSSLTFGTPCIKIPFAQERSSGEMSEVTKKSEKVTSLDVDFRSDSFICSIMLVSVTERELGY